MLFLVDLRKVMEFLEGIAFFELRTKTSLGSRQVWLTLGAFSISFVSDSCVCVSIRVYWFQSMFEVFWLGQLVRW
jgi:hypothetical protein